MGLNNRGGSDVITTFIVFVLFIIICNKITEKEDTSSSDYGVEDNPIANRQTIKTVPDISTESFYQACEREGKKVNLGTKNGDIVPVHHPVGTRFSKTAPKGVTLSQMGESFYSSIKLISEQTSRKNGGKNLGGVKLLTDLSAQASGIYDVNEFQAGTVVRFYPPASWGFKIHPRNGVSLFSRVCDQKIEFIRGEIKE